MMHTLRVITPPIAAHTIASPCGRLSDTSHITPTQLRESHRHERLNTPLQKSATSQGREIHFRFPFSAARSARPVNDFLLRTTASGVPSATMRPPPSPPSG